MNTTKLSRKEWAAMVEKGLRKHEFLSKRSRSERFWRYIARHKTISILLGLTAIMIYLNQWGARELFKTMVTYTIMITLLATIFASITQKK